MNQSILQHAIRRPASPWSAPMTPTIFARRTPRAHDVLLCIQTGKTVDDDKPDALSSLRTSTSAARRRWRRCSPATRGALENTQKHRRRCATWNLPSASTTCPNSSCRRGIDSFILSEQAVRRGLQGRGTAMTTEYREPAGIRAGHDRENGLYRLFPHRVRLCALRQEPGHSRWGRAAAARRGSMVGLLPAASPISTP